MDKKKSRIRRAKKTRCKIRSLEFPRLTIHRTPRHIYAQVINGVGAETVVSASTVQAAVKSSIKGSGNVEAAKVVGKTIAEKCISAGINQVAFDRSGFKYHGRVQALAEAAREAGLKC